MSSSGYFQWQFDIWSDEIFYWYLTVFVQGRNWHWKQLSRKWYDIEEGAECWIILTHWFPENMSPFYFNSLPPGRCVCNLNSVIFKLICGIYILSIPCEIALMWMLQDLTADQLTSFQVMAWCRQATSDYLSQCWLRSMSSHGITRPQWIKWCPKSPCHIHWNFILTLSTWYICDISSTMLNQVHTIFCYHIYIYIYTISYRK